MAERSRTDSKEPVNVDMLALASTPLIPKAPGVARPVAPPAPAPDFDLDTEVILRRADERIFKRSGPLLVAGRYELIGEVGAGSHGVVYRARDRKVNGVSVAVKLLRASRALGDSAHAALLRERDVMARLGSESENIVEIRDSGVFCDQAYLVMGFVEGRTLRQAQAGARPRQVLGLYLQAGRGLAYAHRRDVVHGDFKPENVLVSTEGRVLVADFGHGARRDGDTQVPSRGPGTWRYRAPEQQAGGVGDPRSDQYSFCVALFEAIYQRLPHGDMPAVGDSAATTAGADGGLGRTDAPGTLELVGAQGRAAIPWRFGVPSGVREVLRRGLERDPERRHASMDSLVEALASAIRSASRSVRFARWSSVGGLLLALTSGGWLAFQQLRTADSICNQELSVDQQRCATLARRYNGRLGATEVEAFCDLGDRLNRDLDQARRDVCNGSSPAGERVQSFECLADQREQWTVLVSVADSVEVSVADLQRGISALGTPLECGFSGARSEDLRSPLARGRLLPRGIAEARVLEHMKRYDQGLGVAQAALAEVTADDDRTLRALAEYQMARLQHYLESHDAAEESLQRALALARVENNRALIVDIDIFGVKNASRAHSRPDEAERYYREARELLEETPNSVQEAVLADNYALHVDNLELFAGAIELRERTIERFDSGEIRARGLYPHERVDLYLNHALVLLGDEKHDLASAALSAAERIAEASFGANYPEQVEILRTRAMLAESAGDGGTSARAFRVQATQALDRLMALGGGIATRDQDRQRFSIVLNQLEDDYGRFAAESASPGERQALSGSIDQLMRLDHAVTPEKRVQAGATIVAALLGLGQRERAVKIARTTVSAAENLASVDPRYMVALKVILAAILYDQSKGMDRALLDEVIAQCGSMLTGSVKQRVFEDQAMHRARVASALDFVPADDAAPAWSMADVNWVEALYLRGTALALRGDYDAAIADLVEAMQRSEPLDVSPDFRAQLRGARDAARAHKPLKFHEFIPPLN